MPLLEDFQLWIKIYKTTKIIKLLSHLVPLMISLTIEDDKD